MYYFLQGLTLGLAYVAPIGVQNLFVINSAMTQSRRRALLTALIDGTMMLGAFYVTLPPGQSSAFIAGVAYASASWFTGLSLAVSLFSDRIGPKLLRAVNAVCGVVIIFYGLKLLYGLTRFF